MFCGVALGVMMAACATNAFAQTDGTTEFRGAGEVVHYGLFQVGATTEDTPRALFQAGATTEKPLLAVGVDFGQAINRHVEIYLAGGWQEAVPTAAFIRDTIHFTSGVKLMLTETVVRPYVLAGAGLMHFRPSEALHVDGTDKFLGELGAGVAFPVGAQGYIDVGYHYFQPYHVPGFTPNGVFAGFGFRY